MAKSAGRKTSENEASQTDPLSPEEAERAAAAFIPMWQLDEAPFSLGTSTADLESLSGPLTQPLALQLAPPPVIGAATLPSATAPPDPAAEELSTATLRMAALHQPLPPRPKEPSLPSVILEPSQSVPPPPLLAAEPSVIIEPTPAPAAPARAPASPLVSPLASPPASLREPKTDPPAGPASVPDYEVPRKRTPMVLGLVAAASGVAILAGYLISSPTEAQPTGPAPTNISAPTVSAPAIPPPSPLAPAVTATVPPAVAPAAPPVPAENVASPPVATTVTAPTAHPTPASPAAPPVDHTSSHSSSSAGASGGSRWTAVPSGPATSTSPTPKKPTPKPTPAPASGGIVRDNPF